LSTLVDVSGSLPSARDEIRQLLIMARRGVISVRKTPPWRRRWSRPTGPALRFMILVAIVAVLFVTALVAGPDRETLLQAARGGSMFAPVAAVVGSALLVAAMVPRTWLAFAGGALFGSVAGAMYVLAGVTVGAGLAFLVGRLLGRSFVSTKLRGRFALIEASVARRGVWAVVVCRLIPIVPFAISNYAFGTTSVRPRQMIAGTMLGALPATFAYSALGSATMHGDWLGAKVAGGCVLALGACGVIGTYLVWRRRPHAAPRVVLTK
jgi:uncharacterized membrane protein YdjX (TVP38/TMEM64 family)